MSNGGQVVTQTNLKRISSLADSDNTGVLVGNKVVGFKAVYQVTDAPEVYSAAQATLDGSVFDGLGVGFALERCPFEDERLVAAVEANVADFFTNNKGLAESMRKAGHKDLVAAVRSEFEAAAGFRFPLPRTDEDLGARAAQLGIPDQLRAAMRTLVVLPLRDRAAQDDAASAIASLVQSADDQAQAELAVLFLPGVGELVVLDQVRDQQWTYVC